MSLDFRILELSTVDSTNEACRRHAESGAAAGLVVRADIQTGGRGRRGREWVSPAGNLYCSILLRPSRPANEAAALGFAAVAAVGDVVTELLPRAREVGHKWPNDLLVDGRKTSGLLLEAQSGPNGGLAWLVIGLGVNIVSHPPETRYPATDLCEMGAENVAPGELLAAFLSAFGPLLGAWELAGYQGIEAAWNKRALGIGREIEVVLDNATLRGRYRSLDKDGALVLELAGGGTRRISAGEIFFPGFNPAMAGT